MSLQCLLVILLLYCRVSYIYGVVPECEVKEKLEYKLDSPVTFKALARPYTTFQAEVFCKNDFLLRHLLTFDSNSTKLSRNSHQGIPTSNTLPSPGFVEGWTQFSLAVGLDGYDFLDSKGRSWIPKDVSSECQADKVTLSKGQLVDSCGDGAPTWQVSGEKCVEIPLPKTGTGWVANLALYSNTSFTPSFLVGGTELVLGWKNGGLKLVSDATLPLPPQRRYCLSFSRSSDGIIKFQALQGGHSQEIISLTSAVLKISACGKLSGSFKLQQSNEKCGGIPNGGNLLLVTLITLGTVVAVTIKFICCWYFLKCRRKTREKEIRIRKPNTSPPPIPSESPLASLGPLPETVPLPSPSLRMPDSHSLQDEIYCEMETLTSVAPPGSFSLGLAQVHEEQEEEETINDVYISAG